MCNAMQYIKNFPTLWPKDKDKKILSLCSSGLQLENHGMRVIVVTCITCWLLKVMLYFMK